MEITNRIGKAMGIKLTEPGSGNRNGNEQLETGDSGIEKGIAVHL